MDVCALMVYKTLGETTELLKLGSLYGGTASPDAEHGQRASALPPEVSRAGKICH